MSWHCSCTPSHYDALSIHLCCTRNSCVWLSSSSGFPEPALELDGATGKYTVGGGVSGGWGNGAWAQHSYNVLISGSAT